MTARRDAEWANFVVSTGLSFTPDEYLGFTVGQRTAAREEHSRKE